jgi:hypothetical protein
MAVHRESLHAGPLGDGADGGIPGTQFLVQLHQGFDDPCTGGFQRLRPFLQLVTAFFHISEHSCFIKS